MLHNIDMLQYTKSVEIKPAIHTKYIIVYMNNWVDLRIYLYIYQIIVPLDKFGIYCIVNSWNIFYCFHHILVVVYMWFQKDLELILLNIEHIFINPYQNMNNKWKRISEKEGKKAEENNKYKFNPLTFKFRLSFHHYYYIINLYLIVKLNLIMLVI